MTDFLDLNDDVHARRLLFVVAILLLVIPFFQAGAVIWPLRLTNIQWRFAAANGLSSVLLLPFLGASLLALLGRSSEGNAVRYVAGGIAALFAIALAASVVVFFLDAQQLQAIVSSAMADAFRTTTARVATVTSIFVLAFSYLALVCLLKTRNTVGSARSTARKASEKAEEDVGLIVGVRD